MPILRSLALGSALMCAALAAHATPVTYNLTLTATADSTGAPLSTYNGTGTLVVPSAASSTGLDNFGSAPVMFLIDGVSFSGTATSVEFLNGAFYNASFSEQVGSSPNRFDLQTSGSYVFYFDNELQEASGTITAVPAATSSVTPEPSGIALLGTGLLGIAGVVRRRLA
jgi:hypothetical protein